jgi:TonB family protein
MASVLHLLSLGFPLPKGRLAVRARTGLSCLVLGLGVLVCSQPSAFSQESSQPAITRKIKARVDPKYPGLAKQYQLTGKVKIELTVSPDGSVKKARVIGGSPLLADAAVDAAKQWKYESGSKETVETVDFLFEATTK